MSKTVKISTKPQKTIIAITASIILAVLFDGSKKKIKKPKKYKNFPKRVSKNYKLIDDILKKTVARDLYKKADEQYKSQVLQNLKIENGEFINI